MFWAVEIRKDLKSLTTSVKVIEYALKWSIHAEALR